MTNSDFTVVKNFVKGVRVEHDKLLDQKFVAQETGKDLSTNDFTDAYKVRKSIPLKISFLTILKSVSTLIKMLLFLSNPATKI